MYNINDGVLTLIDGTNIIEDNLNLANTSITTLPDNLTVGCNLDLANTPITTLPDNLTVGGDLYLADTPIITLPDNLTVGGNLDLVNTTITTLPDNLTVGGNLNLKNTYITRGAVVYNCGYHDRTIYIKPNDPTIIHIGCFKGTKEEALEAVNNKYGKSIYYYNQVLECFRKAEVFYKNV